MEEVPYMESRKQEGYPSRHLTKNARTKLPEQLKSVRKALV